MALNSIATTQPANQKPTGNLYMNPGGTTSLTAPSSQPAIAAPVSPTPAVKNTWDAKIAPADMPGYAGHSRLIANPDYVAGSVKPGGGQVLGATTDTSQSPSAQQNPQGQPNIGQSGLPAPMGTDANGNYNIDLSKVPKGPVSPYQQAFQNTKASGAQAPQSADVGRTQVSNAVNQIPEAQDMTVIDATLSNDKGYQQLLKDQQKYNDVTQHTSLVDTYKQLTEQSGIPAINTELLNTNKIIQGTEDDIRHEVQAVSGFATDSQILALSSARNKTLIANYNNLLDAKNMAMENVKTMIGLAQSDQQSAQQSIIAKMGIDEKLMAYRDKFVTNASEGYNNIIKSVRYQGLLTSLSSDPTSIPIVEKTLQASGVLPAGMSIKQLARAEQAQQAQQARLESNKAYNTAYASASGKAAAEAKGGQVLGATTDKSSLAYRNSQAIHTILGSGKFTKDQANAVTNSINNGEDPFTVVKNQAKNIMGQTEATTVTKYETAKSSLQDLQNSLKEFYANGGKTDIFKGNYEKTINKLGNINDPKLVDLATQIQANLQVYRNAISGTAYSSQEGADIASIFPGINKSEGLNNAILNGRFKAFDSTIDGAYKSALGSSYDQFKNAEKSSTNTQTPESSGTTIMKMIGGKSTNLVKHSDGKYYPVN